VTGVHLAEHLGFDALLDVVDEARRVLRPGGVLILETPNPTTWHVGADLFHLDPTHLRPVHPLLLEFLLTNTGFVDVRTRMLHPYEASPPEPAADVDPAVAELVARFAAMWGGPQDYAVIGRQPPGVG
jgi:O-antigen chain-terminating methyltransferase